jgi:hypothetical protein
MQIKISEILNDLTNGQTRQQIKEKYNLSTAQLKSVFAHPLLKGRKTKKVEQPIDLVDDISAVDTRPAYAIVEPQPVVETVRPALVDDANDDNLFS